MNWNFDQNKNVAAITTKQVIEEAYPILQVIHYSEDHSWAFICGTTSDPTDAKIVSMEQIVSIDITLHEISDLAPGWIASRQTVGGAWARQFDPDI